MDGDGCTPHLVYFELYRTTRPSFVLLCHHQTAVHTALFLPLINTPFPLLESWVDPLYSAEPILYLFRHIFIPVGRFAVVFDMRLRCSEIKLAQSDSFMPRRPPPTPLLLVQGPLPPRGTSKFTMPSVPRPAFHPPTATGVVRRRVSCDAVEAGAMRAEQRGDLATPSRTVSR